LTPGKDRAFVLWAVSSGTLSGGIAMNHISRTPELLAVVISTALLAAACAGSQPPSSTFEPLAALVGALVRTAFPRWSLRYER
jgi:hypothetical protein